MYSFSDYLLLYFLNETMYSNLQFSICLQLSILYAGLCETRTTICRVFSLHCTRVHAPFIVSLEISPDVIAPEFVYEQRMYYPGTFFRWLLHFRNFINFWDVNLWKSSRGILSLSLVSQESDIIQYYDTPQVFNCLRLFLVYVPLIASVLVSIYDKRSNDECSWNMPQK